MKKIGSFVLTLFFWSQSCALADVTISASIDKTKVALNESVQLSVVIEGSGNIPAPQLPDLSNFSVYSSGRSQNISFVNGQVSSSITHSYILSPKSVGKFMIHPFSLTVDGKMVQTEPIEIEVLSASSPPSSPPQTQAPSLPSNSHATQLPGAFVKMSLDKSNVMVNEQVILTFRFYYRIRLISNPEYRSPEKSGFLFEDLPPPKNFTESVQGTPFHVTEIRTALFPTQTGKVTIPPATLKIQVEDFSSDPFSGDFFSQFFGGQRREYLLKSDPVTLIVSPLPAENRPKNFHGGIGQFKIVAQADKLKLSVGEPLTITVSISGVGNIKSLGEISPPPLTTFRKYDVASSLNIDHSKGRVEGSKVYKMVLVPQVSGLEKIPPINFSYFDLTARKYKTIATAPIPIEVTPAKSTGVIISPLTYLPSQIQQVGQDIRYIRTDKSLQENFDWIHQKPWFIPMNLVPIFALLGSIALRWRKNVLEKNPDKRRVLYAYKKAKKELKTISVSRVSSTEEKSSKLFEILQNYFADKMVSSPSGLSLRMIEDYMVRSGIDEETIKKLKVIWGELEQTVYAPDSFRSIDLERIFSSLLELLKQIENQLEKTSRLTFKKLALIIPFIFSFSYLFSISLEEKSQEANRFYQEGQFESARTAYKEIQEENISNFFLEYNLGNAHYKCGQLGQAIVHWIRAWRIQPRNSDVKHNLSLGSSQSGHPFFPQPFFERFLKLFIYFFNLNELSILFMISLWFSASVWSWQVLRRERIGSQQNLFILLTFFVTASWWFWRFYDQQVRQWAVVTVQKAEARSGPGKQFGVGFTIPEGRKVLVMHWGVDSSWIEIGLSQEGIKGWVEHGSISLI